MVSDNLQDLSADLKIITARAASIEQEHKRLLGLVDSMAERLEAKDYFIVLMAPYMAPVEAKKDVIIEEFAELLRAYRKATEGGEAE